MGNFISFYTGLDDNTIHISGKNVVVSGNGVVSGNNVVSGNVTISNNNNSVNSGNVTISNNKLNPITTRPIILIPTTKSNENVPTNSHGIPLSFSDFFKKMIEASHIYILLWFIIIYVLVYIVFGYYLKSTNVESMDLIMSRTFDCMIFIPLFVYLMYSYYIASDDKKDNIVLYLWQWSVQWMDDIMNLFGVILFSVCFYLMVYFLQIPMTHDKMPFSIHFLESKIWTFIATFLILMFFKHFLGIDLLIILNNYVIEFLQTPNHLKLNDTSSNPPPPIVDIPSPNPPTKYDEVFNIGNNLYTYEDAQNICSVYGARLANYEEIEDSYNHGGEWCNYGWSDGQMVFFPTQKSTWDKLQKDPKRKNACGRPGVNGGYINNPYIRFGVNCYGKRPDAKKSDLDKMNQPITIPKTQQEIAMDQKIQFWKDNADKLLQINSFNNTNWSEF